MKKTWKKLLSIALTVSLIGIIAGCNHSEPEEPTPEEKTTYSLSVDKKTLNLVAGGDAAVITVTTNGTATVDVENKNVATAVLAENKVTVTPVAAGSTTIVIGCKEDTSKEIEIPVVVEKTTMVLTLTLDDDVAVPGGAITVLYGNGGDKNPDAYENYTEVMANVAADGKSATVELDKAKASSDGWFNGLKITVTDTNGNEVEVIFTPYFEFNADGYTLQIMKPAEKKTFTINFQGFEIAGGSVEGLKYSNKWAKSSSDWDEESITVPVVTVAADGKSATFDISSDTLLSDTHEFYIDWTLVVIKDSEGNAVTISSGLTAANEWYDYSGTDESKWAITAVDTSSSNTIKENISIPSSTNGTSVVEFVAAADMPASASTIIITYTVGESDIVSSDTTWITVYSGTNWSNATKVVDAWTDGFEVKAAGETYTGIITNAADFITNGIYIAADSAAYTGTFTVTYTE